MQFIHFTGGATDALQEPGAQRARFVPLAESCSDAQVSCLYPAARRLPSHRVHTTVPC
jgi:hypothetical protein